MNHSGIEFDLNLIRSIQVTRAMILSRDYEELKQSILELSEYTRTKKKAGKLVIGYPYDTTKPVVQKIIQVTAKTFGTYSMYPQMQPLIINHQENQVVVDVIPKEIV